jgi:transcriptional regulator with XRE-family HTH domain
MGGAHGGRRPDLGRRREVSRLRAEGLSVPEIALRLGISRQGVHYHLRAQARARVPPPPVLCRRCGAVALAADCRLRERGPDLCPECVARQPGVPFGVVLRAYRLAAGYTRAQLARLSGVAARTICSCEDAGRGRPRRDTLAKLAGVLGSGLWAAADGDRGAGDDTSPPTADARSVAADGPPRLQGTPRACEVG